MQDVNQEASKLFFVYVPGEQLSLVVHIPHLLYYMNLWLGARNISKVTVTQIVDVYAVRFVLQWVSSALFGSYTELPCILSTNKVHHK